MTNSSNLLTEGLVKHCHSQHHEQSAPQNDVDGFSCLSRLRAIYNTLFLCRSAQIEVHPTHKLCTHTQTHTIHIGNLGNQNNTTHTSALRKNSNDPERAWRISTTTREFRFANEEDGAACAIARKIKEGRRFEGCWHNKCQLPPLSVRMISVALSSNGERRTRALSSISTIGVDCVQ